MSKVRIISPSFKPTPKSVGSMLRSERLFKTLSLWLADRAGVGVPETRLLLEDALGDVSAIVKEWGCPVMLRMDYRKLPKSKPIGGIPVYSEDALIKLSRYLFSRDLLPLFHPHASRFEDRYSAGVMLDPNSRSAKIEIVGKGFDAGDLRLGWGGPHQVLEIDLAELKSVSSWIVAKEQYANERISRLARVRQISEYTTIANDRCQLSAQLPGEDFANRVDHSGFDLMVPIQYSPIPPGVMKSLANQVFTIWSQVLPLLPQSNEYVASLSWLPKKGWTLWDVYGHWYLR